MAREKWTSCPPGVTVAADMLATGGHTWFRAIGAAAGDNLLLTFFASHPHDRDQLDSGIPVA